MGAPPLLRRPQVQEQARVSPAPPRPTPPPRPSATTLTSSPSSAVPSSTPSSITPSSSTTPSTPSTRWPSWAPKPPPSPPPSSCGARHQRLIRRRRARGRDGVRSMSRRECRIEEARLDCVVDKAFANGGAMMAARVEGAVSVEVVASRERRRRRRRHRRQGATPPRHVPRARRRCGPRVAEDSVHVGGHPGGGSPRSRAARWRPRDARCLRAPRARSRRVGKYDGASVVQTYVGRVRTWYARHPVALAHNNLADAPDAGIELARQMCALFPVEAEARSSPPHR